MSEFWNKRYNAGHQQRYPWDSVVSFVFRETAAVSNREEVSILEVGFGTGANLLFAAREGFKVAGVEYVQSAVDVARNRFKKEGLHGDLLQGSFTSLPFEDDSFDLIIDRAALTCSPLPEITRSIDEITRVSKPGAKFFFNPYADSHSSARSGNKLDENTRLNLDEGSLAGLDRITFISEKDIRQLLKDCWKIESLKRIEALEMKSAAMDIHSEWIAVSIKL